MDIAISTFLDIVLLAVLALSVYFGYRHGLIRSAIRLVGSIVALIVALTFSASLGNYIDNNYVNAPMREWVVDRLSASVDQVSATEVNFDDLFENRPEFFVEVCSYLDVDIEDLQREYEALKSEGSDSAKSALVSRMVDPMSAVVSRVIAFFVIFIAALIAICVISLFSRFLTNLPIVRNLDKFGGLAVGLFTGVLLSFVLVSVVSIGSKYVLKDYSAEQIDSIFEKTVVYETVSKINPLNSLFEDSVN